MSEYSSAVYGIVILEPSYLEKMVIGVQKGYTLEWRFARFDPIAQELYGVAFGDAMQHRLISVDRMVLFLEYCQIRELIDLFAEGNRYTNGASARDIAGEPCDARSERALSWSLTGGIRKVGSNLRKYFMENISAFEEEVNSWFAVSIELESVRRTIYQMVQEYLL